MNRDQSTFSGHFRDFWISKEPMRVALCSDDFRYARKKFLEHTPGNLPQFIFNHPTNPASSYASVNELPPKKQLDAISRWEDHLAESIPFKPCVVFWCAFDEMIRSRQRQARRRLTTRIRNMFDRYQEGVFWILESDVGQEEFLKLTEAGITRRIAFVRLET